MIGAISGLGTAAFFNPYSCGLGRSAQTQAAQRPETLWAARRSSPEAPVEPVRPVKAVTPQDSQPRLLPNSLPSLREGADPAELAVRMRIQYADPSQAAQADEAEQAEGADAALGAEDVRKVAEEAECQTCARRKYQDGSDDPGVSFKTPTSIDPSQAASAVRGHEMEHVVREQSKAQREDRKVVSQSVNYHTAICPECGRVYVSGGTTRTVTAADNGQPDPARSAQEDRQDAQGIFAAA